MAKKLSESELQDLVDRLSRVKTNEAEAKRERKKANLSQEDIDEISQRLSSHRKVPSQPEPNRGEKRSPMDIDRIVERLAVSKRNDSEANQTDRRNNVKMSKKDFDEMVARLSNKETAMEKTPDRKRVPDKTFGIVTSYAWNNNNFRAILTNDESP